MRVGVSFLKSKITRRFCLLFIVSAFLPTVLLITFAYNRVVRQVEEQSFVQLKSETQVYALGVFDRMIRIDNELRSIGRQIELLPKETERGSSDYTGEVENIFSSLIQYIPTEKRAFNIYNTITEKTLQRILEDELFLSPKPFVRSLNVPGKLSRLFFGVTMDRRDGSSVTVIGEVKPSFLWGIGASPVLPPMTELSVFDASGSNMVVSGNVSISDYSDIEKIHVKDDLRVFKYAHEGTTYFSSYANLFIESRFQRTGWIIVFSQDRNDIMATLESFKTTLPPIVLLFLLLILYMSMSFIRKGLEPLTQLKAGTKRVAQKDFSSKVNIQSDDEFEELGSAFNTMTDRIEQQFNALDMLSEIDRAILSSLDRHSIISTTLFRVKQFFQSDVSVFVRCNDDSGNYAKIFVMKGRRKSDPKIEYQELTEEERQLMFANKECLVLGEGGAPTPPFLQDLHHEVCNTFWCFPIHLGGKTERALLLGWKKFTPVQPEDISHARQVVDQLAIALANAILMENIENLAKGTIEALARTVDAKSQWTSGHSERVADMSHRIGRAMGLSEKSQETLLRGGLLHDIGKIGITQTILDKPGKLSDVEYTEIKNHPEIGAKILEPIAAYQDILSLIAQHHEKYDGTGYPHGIEGDEIDIRARIVAVADVWDALVSDRPYREGWIQDKARKLIVDKAGQDFDPEVVKAFLAVINEEYSS